MKPRPSPFRLVLSALFGLVCLAAQARADDPSAELLADIRADSKSVKESFVGATLAPGRIADLERDYRAVSAPSAELTAAWRPYHDAADSYRAFCARLPALQGQALREDVRETGRRLGLTADQIEPAVPKYLRVQAALRRDGVSWKDGRFVRADGAPFAPAAPTAPAEDMSRESALLRCPGGFDGGVCAGGAAASPRTGTAALPGRPLLDPATRAAADRIVTARVNGALSGGNPLLDRRTVPAPASSGAAIDSRTQEQIRSFLLNASQPSDDEAMPQLDHFLSGELKGLARRDPAAKTAGVYLNRLKGILHCAQCDRPKMLGAWEDEVQGYLKFKERAAHPTISFDDKMPPQDAQKPDPVHAESCWRALSDHPALAQKCAEDPNAAAMNVGIWVALKEQKEQLVNLTSALLLLAPVLVALFFGGGAGDLVALLMTFGFTLAMAVKFVTTDCPRLISAVANLNRIPKGTEDYYRQYRQTTKLAVSAVCVALLVFLGAKGMQELSGKLAGAESLKPGLLSVRREYPGMSWSQALGVVLKTKPGLPPGESPRPVEEGAAAKLTETPNARTVPSAKPAPAEIPENIFPVDRYFTSEEFMKAHPEPAEGDVYHDWRHSLRVPKMAQEFANARGLSAADSKFVGEVALLHDFDPGRAPGTPARAPETLSRLRRDFNGELSLTGQPGRSVLVDRFGWTERDLRKAEAMIQRTEFPFAGSHPNPFYKGASPLARYEGMLKDLSPGDRRFVLREGAYLSEYADKSSHYATEDFGGALKVVNGLVGEINTSAGKPVTEISKLDTYDFLSKVGTLDSFALDRALAEKFGVKDFRLMNREQAFALLPKSYGEAFNNNLAGFKAFNEALRAGKPVAEAARIAEQSASSPKRATAAEPAPAAPALVAPAAKPGPAATIESGLETYLHKELRLRLKQGVTRADLRRIVGNYLKESHVAEGSPQGRELLARYGFEENAGDAPAVPRPQGRDSFPEGPPPAQSPAGGMRPSGVLRIGGSDDLVGVTLDRKPEPFEATFLASDREGRGVAVKTAHYVSVVGQSELEAQAALRSEAQALRQAGEISRQAGFPTNVDIPGVRGLGYMDQGLAQAIYGERQRVPILLIERARGVELSRWLDARRSLNQQDFAGLMKAVQLLNDNGLAHGDLHTGNILVREDPATGRQFFSLLDFGASKNRSAVSAGRWAGLTAADAQALRGIANQAKEHGQLRSGPVRP